MFDIYKLRAAKYPHFSANQERAGYDAPCICCGKGCKRPTREVHLSDGGIHIITESEAQQFSDKGEMGWWPIGPDCYRSNPELHPYVRLIRKG